MLYIFDWDGTLSDSTTKIVGCMQRAASDLRLPELAGHEIKEIIGLGLPEAIAQIYPSVNDGDQQRLREQYSKRFIEADQVPSPFFPEAIETLSALRDRGHYITVATGKSRRGLNRVFSNLQLDDFFHGSRCADETASKPHPLMLNELLAEFGCSAQEAVMIGDTEFDMDMARRASMARIAVSFGAHAVERLQAYNPLHCIDCLDELLSLGETKTGHLGQNLEGINNC